MTYFEKYFNNVCMKLYLKNIGVGFQCLTAQRAHFVAEMTTFLSQKSKDHI